MILLFLIVMTTLPGLQAQDNVFLSWAHSYVNLTGGFVGSCLCR